MDNNGVNGTVVCQKVRLHLKLNPDHAVDAGHGIAGLVLVVHIGQILAGHEQFSFIFAGHPVEHVAEFAVNQIVAVHGIVVRGIGPARLRVDMDRGDIKSSKG